MSNTENAQRAEEFYTLLMTDFEAATKKYIADGFIWENPLPDSIPFGGRYEGVDGLMTYLGALDAAIEMSPLNITDILADGPVVAVIGVEQDTRLKSNGKTYTMPFVHVLRFNEDGKIQHVREYNDTREMVAAFGG